MDLHPDFRDLLAEFVREGVRFAGVPLGLDYTPRRSSRGDASTCFRITRRSALGSA